MKHELVEFIKGYKRRSIELQQLEGICPGGTDYAEFAEAVKELVVAGILSEYESNVPSVRDNSLSLKYKVKQYKLRENAICAVQEFALKNKIHKEINLSLYMTEHATAWEGDKQYIKMLSDYLYKYGLPGEEVTDQERSYDITGNEKWILEGGKKVLERVGMQEKLKISYLPEPLMIAVNPQNFNRDNHTHLIVENKATYYRLLEALPQTTCTSLVFGSGWKIVANITALEKQVGLPNSRHQLYYFGDLDHEGISIWNALHDKRKIQLAKDFYLALLAKKPSEGKTNQQENSVAMGKFFSCFSANEGKRMQSLLQQGEYYPQESLSQDELQCIWRTSTWASI